MTAGPLLQHLIGSAGRLLWADPNDPTTLLSVERGLPILHLDRPASTDMLYEWRSAPGGVTVERYWPASAVTRRAHPDLGIVTTCWHEHDRLVVVAATLDPYRILAAHSIAWPDLGGPHGR